MQAVCHSELCFPKRLGIGTKIRSGKGRPPVKFRAAARVTLLATLISAETMPNYYCFVKAGQQPRAAKLVAASKRVGLNDSRRQVGVRILLGESIRRKGGNINARRFAGCQFRQQ